MDLVDFKEDVYNKIKEDFKAFSKLEIQDMHFVPISALHGDNVVDRSANMHRRSTLHLLENVHIGSDHNHVDCRFPV